MANWIQKDLERIGVADELHLTSFKQDSTPRKPVTIWDVRVNGDVCIPGSP